MDDLPTRTVVLRTAPPWDKGAGVVLFACGEDAVALSAREAPRA